ncbi:MAG: alpha/beta hydrolase [Pseudomonadota bacterium]
MKRFLSVLATLVVVTGVAGSFLFWQATRGVAADDLEATYLTVDDRFLEIAGARVRVRITGPSSAPPILLVHGFSYSLESWDAWAADLETDYRVIRYDLLGHGLTGPDPKERYAPQERAAFIGNVLDALEIEKAVIAGNSLGGLAAWRFASSNPERVKALILVSPGAFSINGVGDEPAPIPPAMTAYLLTVPEAGVRASAQLVWGDDSKITEERLDVMQAMMQREGNGDAMIASLEEFTLPDPSADLAKVRTPTLLLWGEKDILIPLAHGERIASIMPDATLVTYPGVGHAAHEEAPRATVSDAREFLARHIDGHAPQSDENPSVQ